MIRSVVATTLEDAESMRFIRNTCREFMTKNTSYIDAQQQETWWRTLDRAHITPLLFYVEENVIGYGICRFESSRWWVTGGLLPSWRGRGLGEEIFKAMLRFTGVPCSLEVRETNAAARHLYEKLGFVETGASDGIITMEKTA